MNIERKRSPALIRSIAAWAVMGSVTMMLPSASAAAGDGESRVKTAPEIERLQGFAFSACIADAFPNTPVAADAGRASAAYVELGESPFEVYGAIVAVVKRHMTRAYVSKSGGSLHVLQCLDLAHDPAVMAVIKQYSPRKTGRRSTD